MRPRNLRLHWDYSWKVNYDFIKTSGISFNLPQVQPTTVAALCAGRVKSPIYGFSYAILT
jgi:hypothetical protein